MEFSAYITLACSTYVCTYDKRTCASSITSPCRDKN